MLSFLQSQFLFYITIILALFLPGYSLLLAVFGKSRALSTLEKFVISFGLGIISVDFIFFAYDKLQIPITRISSVVGLTLFILVCLAVYRLRKTKDNSEDKGDLFDFSGKQLALILLLIFLTIFIKTAYLSGTVLPTATDLGHHMYWAKWMAENGQLPDYEGMPDFIIGEHIIFGVISLISGAGFFSAFPVVVLYLVNLLGILAVFVLTLRVFENKNVAILTLLFLGVLYAVSSPQAKFVSGGVVGNILGNFLLPLTFYFYYRAFAFLNKENFLPAIHSQTFLGLAVFSTFGLFYTHHLTAFIFLFIFAFLMIFFSLVNYKEIKKIMPPIFKNIFSPAVIAVFLACLIFFFFVFTPNYVQTSAVDTAVGAPSKATRAGLDMADLKSAVGETRIALGFLGLLFLFYYYQKRHFGYAIVAAWALAIYLMSTQPHLLSINLPSNRIGSYFSYPLAILSAYGFYMAFSDRKTHYLVKGVFVSLLIFVLAGGLYDSAVAFKSKAASEEIKETFNASAYLVKSIDPSDIVLKDHNYITGDAWIKLFFMQGYKYPASRGYFKRYEDPTKPREMCTLHMISNPGGKEAGACFQETGTNFLMVNPRFDSAQFSKLKNFDRVYANPNVAVFHKND